MSHLTIRCAEDLARLAQGAGSWRSIAVEADGLGAMQSEHLADALARGERPCGCVGARRGLAAGIALAALLLAAVDWMTGRWLLAMFLVVLASALGRGLDFVAARYARGKAMRALHRHFSSVYQPAS